MFGAAVFSQIFTSCRSYIYEITSRKMVYTFGEKFIFKCIKFNLYFLKYLTLYLQVLKNFLETKPNIKMTESLDKLF